MRQHSCISTAAAEHHQLIEDARAARQRAAQVITEARAIVEQARNIMEMVDTMRFDREAEQASRDRRY